MSACYLCNRATLLHCYMCQRPVCEVHASDVTRPELRKGEEPLGAVWVCDEDWRASR